MPDRRGRDFALTIITNAGEDSTQVLERHRAAGSSEARDTPLDLHWPDDLFSLGHLALPFARNDPLYGEAHDPAAGHIEIGSAALRGERGVLRIPAADMLRIKWNPFFPYVERRILEFTGLAE
jgi:hypothetical protein